MRSQTQKFDVVIVGGGPAGLSAAIWCADLGLQAAVFEGSATVGGQLERIYGPISNYPGLAAKNGSELRGHFVRHLEKAHIRPMTGMKVEMIDVFSRSVTLSNGESISGRALILAMGVSRRRLDIPGEAKFAGRGILASGTLESGLAVGKTVIVVGGGDAAMENALILSETAKKVYLVHRRKEFSARPEFLKAVISRPNILPLLERKMTEINGDENVDSVVIEGPGAADREILPIDLVLVRIGVEPNSGLVRDDLEVDRKGYIKVDGLCRTSVERVYAIGDIANPIAPTIAGAVGQGATAAKQIAFERSN